MTGWNLPPGCNVRDLPGWGGDPPCEVCGLDVDYCICPECPECGAQGDPTCYSEHQIGAPSSGHGMVRTQAQIDSLAGARKDWEEAQRPPREEDY